MRKFIPLYLRLISFIAITFCFNGVQAQWKVGAFGGYTNNNLSTSSGFANTVHYESRGGFSVGVPVQYSFFDWLAVQAEVSYTQKNYSIVQDLSNNITIQKYKNISNGFLQVPVYAHLSFGEQKLRVFLNAGFYTGYWLSSWNKGNTGKCVFKYIKIEEDMYHQFDEKVPFDSRRDNRFDGGALIGLGVKYQINKKAQVIIEGRYYYGMSDLQKEYMLNQIHRYNNTFSVQVGCMFTLGK